MQSPDGKWRGVGIELWRHVANELHLSYRFEEAKSIDELLANVAQGRVVAGDALPVSRQEVGLASALQPALTGV
jgi:hypothetical protein